MRALELLGSDVVFRNPKPYLRSLQARHPSLVVFEDGELLLGFDLGQSDESLDYATHRARTKDGGRSWQFEGPVLAPTATPQLEYVVARFPGRALQRCEHAFG